MEQIFLYARDSLPTTRKSTRQQPCVDEALQCVQMLVDTYGAELTDQVRELLPRLFGAEIGEPLEPGLRFRKTLGCVVRRFHR